MTLLTKVYDRVTALIKLHELAQLADWSELESQIRVKNETTRLGLTEAELEMLERMDNPETLEAIGLLRDFAATEGTKFNET